MAELHILHLEDETYDAELVRETLADDGIDGEIVHVETRDTFLAALDQASFDIILADFALPAFDGLSALLIAREKTPDVPFIFVSGAIGEELAIETLKQGATDYVLKGRLARLAPSIRRALREVGERRERQWAERALQQAHQELETRVKERTAELVYTNATLLEQIEERERAEKEVQQRNRQLTMLNHITAATSSSLELPAIFTTLRQLLVGQLQIPAGGLFLYDKRADRLELKSFWGVPTTLTDLFQSTAVSDSYLEPVVRQKKVIRKQDMPAIKTSADPELDEGTLEWQDFLAVPFMAQGEVQGAFCLFSNVENLFSENQVAFFSTVGQQVGVAIQNGRLFEEVLTRREQLRQLAQKVVSIQEEERRRVARELHDEAGQALTVLKISLGLIHDGLPAELADIRQSVDEAVDLTGETMESIRLLAHDLRPAELEHVGLSGTLEGLCRDFTHRTQLPVRYEGAELPRLSEPISICLYRVVQEALTNIAKHADARQAMVSIYHDNDIIHLTVVDDGRGFEGHPPSPLTKGIGLSGMRERLEMFGGQLEIESGNGSGTRLLVQVPLSHE